MEIQHIDGLLWTPIRTRPKREKKLEEYCNAHNIINYLPLVQSVKRYGRKTVTFYPPMFSGYIFCLLNEQLYKILVKSNSVFFKVKIDEVSEAQLINDLNNVKILEAYSSEKEIVLKPELIKGTPVLITEGPLSGSRGIITKRKTNVLVTINVEMLGQSISVQMDLGDVEIEK